MLGRKAAVRDQLTLHSTSSEALIVNKWKSDRYITFVPPGESGSLLSVVDPQLHAERRRLWEPSVTSKALRVYREVIQNRIQQLVSLLSQHQQEDINLSTWFSYFSFDVMGDLAFNGQFDVMRSGSMDFLNNLKGIKKALFIQDYMMVFTWLREYIPLVPQKYMKAALWLRHFSTEAVLRRMQEGSKTKDFYYHLLNEEKLDQGSVLPLRVLIREAMLIIPAGYDSVANAISHTFFHLLTNPVYFERLRDEVDQTFSNVDEIYLKDDLQNLPYLNAVINETLRLAPPLASGTQRYLPKGSANGGVMLGNTWIPEGTYVQIHTYSLHRNPKYFSPDPEVFQPERWLDKGYNTDKSAFIPFSYGPANCIGRQIALIKLRKTLCVLLKTFNFELSPEFDINKWNEGVMEQFTLGRGDLLVRIQKRG
ncbi:hypothetical protein Clacol_009592 [Clathrus columnatus]|uniref:Cytochrome P450 n=1 Tax=Clathrus columnatus TaxID=1419009 RepID=A0AAV5AKX6_9AGAM|nr:hypothetical protein Clacol_009592 [Clathrus columnatus]